MKESHDSSFSVVCDWERDLQRKPSSPFSKEVKFSTSNSFDGDFMDSMLCFPESRLIRAGFHQMDFTEDCLMFVNAGGGAIQGIDSRLNFKSDICFHGGDVLRTCEHIINGGDYPSLYQSARYGDFCYQFHDLPPGDYFVDLHFVEIVNTYGPKGVRIFNVYIQEEKVLAGLDIYSIVGANKPLQLVNARVPVTENATMLLKFEAIQGSAVVCGICIRKASKLSAALVESEYLTCNNCSAKIEVPLYQDRAITMQDVIKYKKNIQELTIKCQLKTDECYEAWISLSAANDQLEKLRAELDNKFFQAELLGQERDKQTLKLGDVSERYKLDKKFWEDSINDLQRKVKAMKCEHTQLSQKAYDCANSIPELNKMAFAVQALVSQCEDLKAKYGEELAKRKKLYNQVQEIKGNIRVFCRCRPLSKKEISSGHSSIVDFDAAKDGILGILTGGSTKKTFKFDRVYTPNDNQADVFADASPMVISVLDGFNVCIFAYGQTGTGKTFTMEGTEDNRGVNYRTLEELFKVSKERRETFVYNISVSVLEVYNERIRDLLAPSSSSRRLEIRQAAGGFHHLPGIIEAKVENIKEVWDMLKAGSNARAVGSNNVNEHSSRSHCMLCIMIESKNLMNGECTKSKLWLVDLAGSERLAKTDVHGERLKEAQNINRSLSALGDVISALASKSSHIPYRNSKLTHLLQDSLGGDSKTLMFVQINPSEDDLGETLSSLNFATRVRGVELGPAKKQIDMGELQKMKQMLEKVKQESRYKDESLWKLEENCQNMESKLKSKDVINRNQQEKVRELEKQIESKMELQIQSEKQLQQLQEKLKGREEMYTTLQQKVKELENKLKEQQHGESTDLKRKVKELENKVKEQQQSQHMILQQKVKELEEKLEERQLQSESSILGKRVKELENKLREREQRVESLVPLNSAEMLRAAPSEGKTFSKSKSKMNPSVLKSSNSLNQPVNQGPALLNGAESVNQMKRKRERSGATGEPNDNDIHIPSSLVEKELTNELKRLRQINPAKAMGRIIRTSKTAAATQNASSHNRIGREHVGLKKERVMTRGWLR